MAKKQNNTLNEHFNSIKVQLKQDCRKRKSLRGEISIP